MSAPQIPKRHHYIAEQLQKRFVDHDGWLYAYDERHLDIGIRRTKPRDVFVEGHLYSQIAANGAKDVALELAFSKLEGEIDPVIEKIVTAARQREKPSLTPDEKRAWDIFFYYQWKRVPDRRSRTEFNFEESLNETVREYEAKVRPLTASERASIESPAEKARLLQNAWVTATGLAGEDALDALAQRGLGIILIEKSNCSFVIGSSPIVKFTHPGRTDLRDPTVEMWMPIAYDVAVTTYGIAGEEQMGPADPERHVRNINSAIFEQSTVVASRSEKLIASLLRKRQNVTKLANLERATLTP